MHALLAEHIRTGLEKLHPVAARHTYEATKGGLYLAFGKNKLQSHIIFENIKEQIL